MEFLGVKRDLEKQILQMIYNAKDRNKTLIKQAASIISQLKTFNFPGLLDSFRLLYGLKNVVIVIDQLNMIFRTEQDHYTSKIIKFIDIEECYTKFKIYTCFSNNNSYVRSLINGLINKNAVIYSCINQITNCYDKESAGRFILHNMKNDLIDEITKDNSNINALFLSKLAECYSINKEIKECYDMVCHQLKITEKIKDFNEKFLTDEIKVKTFIDLITKYLDEENSMNFSVFKEKYFEVIDLKLMYFIDYDNEIILLENITDTHNIRIKCLLPQIRRHYINYTKNSDNFWYIKMLDLYFNVQVPPTGRGLIFEYIFIKNMFLYSTDIIRNYQEERIYSIQKTYSIYTLKDLNSDESLRQNIANLKNLETILLIPQKLNEPLFDCYLIKKKKMGNYQIKFIQITTNKKHEIVQLSDLIEYDKLFEEVRILNDKINIDDIYVDYVTKDFGKDDFEFFKIQNLLKQMIGWRIFEFDRDGLNAELHMKINGKNLTPIIKEESKRIEEAKIVTNVVNEQDSNSNKKQFTEKDIFSYKKKRKLKDVENYGDDEDEEHLSQPGKIRKTKK
jgi:hypothetical protein